LQAAIVAALPESPEKIGGYEIPACAGMTTPTKTNCYQNKLPADKFLFLKELV
jgi:hypothetical protein